MTRKRTRRAGFTLIEASLTTIIVGVGVLAMVSAQAAFHKQNDWSSHAAVAMHLGNEIREMSLLLERHDPVTGTEIWGPELNELTVSDFDDLDDFDGDIGTGLVFAADWDPQSDDNGPLNARREVIPNMQGWSQTILVSSVDSLDVATEVADGASDTLRVVVSVEFQGPDDQAPREMTRVTWIA
ncbi:MAG: type IV pilus modification PilV family protein, partial [Planctomycetota bacterium]